MAMKKPLIELLGGGKFIIAGVHFLPLPGSPGYDRAAGMKKIVDRAREETRILVENGVHGMLFANEADIPYLQCIGPETVAAFTAAVRDVMADFSVPYGVNVLLDPVAGVGIANGAGGSFVRGYFAGGYVTDMGIMDSRGPEALRLRSNIGAEHIHLLLAWSARSGPLVERPRRRPTASKFMSVWMASRFQAGRRLCAEPCLFQQGAESGARMPMIAGTGVSRRTSAFLKVSTAPS
jgi:predicted TIM-barrel enzyme